MSKFINTELKSDSDSESSDSESSDSYSDLESPDSNSDSDSESSDSDSDSESSDSDSHLRNLCFSSSVNYNYILKYIFCGSNLNMHLCFGC